MSFRSIVRDVRESFGSLSRRGFEVRISGLPGLSGHHRGKSVGSLSALHDRAAIVDQNGWAGLPPELLRDVMKRLEEGESTWPSRKDVVASAAACKAWREICKDIVQSPEFCGKLTFPLSLKQPGPRDGLIQCFIKRDKSTLTYYLYLCLSPAVLSENGKFLLAAKRNRRTTYTEYVISVDSKNISRSSNGYVGKMRSNFLGTKFIVYDTQPPYNAGSLASCQRASRRISSRRVSPKVPTGSYPVAQVNYELNVLGTRGPRRMQCTMHSIPASALEPEGVVPGQPKQLLPGPFDESFRSTYPSSRFSITDFSSSRFSEVSGVVQPDEEGGEAKERPLVLCNKVPRWHEQLQCWCLNFRGRVTVASVKNFQLTAAPQPAAVPSESSQPPHQQQAQPSSSSSSSSDHEKVILQFGKVTKDMFTMDYRYPLSAFQAFAICLTSFDTKLACE
ncbi:tubby-like F-box protein 12 [Lolium perenne]|uniref:tubby-like F-box protein 12 n=1 Tax=Lolium perenne TaxID=4522 RepID=UPI0021EA547F|nr:tubby-like F-box protein 12 [Lolium perenne]XP_051200014.1 tubby-like F-box protein 12 [Lolium perenne]